MASTVRTSDSYFTAVPSGLILLHPCDKQIKCAIEISKNRSISLVNQKRKEMYRTLNTTIQFWCTYTLIVGKELVLKFSITNSRSSSPRNVYTLILLLAS
jgi:hypothetical protein